MGAWLLLLALVLPLILFGGWAGGAILAALIVCAALIFRRNP
jgi:hypothetical protein